MNDKRCPVCDFLAEEYVPKCHCGFVFFDDTPDHIITRKRTFVTMSVLCAAAVLGFGLNYAYGGVTLAAFVLSAIPVTFLLMPSVRKQGGLALSVATLLVFWVSISIGKTWKAYNPVLEVSPIVEFKQFDVTKPMLIDGVDATHKAPRDLPSDTVYSATEEGDFKYIFGDQLSQEGEVILKVGDLAERYKRNFTAKKAETGLRILGGRDYLLYLVVSDERVAKIGLFQKGSSLGSGPEIDGARLGMTSSVLAYKSPEFKGRVLNMTEQSRFSYREEHSRIIGISGTHLKTQDGTEIYRGQEKATVEKIKVARRKKATTCVSYDENDRVQSIYSGVIKGSLLAEPLLKVSEDWKISSQECLGTSDKNEITAWKEVWQLPTAVLKIVTRPLGERELRASRIWGRYKKGQVETEPFVWQVGEKCHWGWPSGSRQGSVKFIHQARYYELTFNYHNGSEIFEPTIMKRVAEAIIEKRKIEFQ